MSYPSASKPSGWNSACALCPGVGERAREQSEPGPVRGFLPEAPRLEVSSGNAVKLNRFTQTYVFLWGPLYVALVEDFLQLQAQTTLE